MEKTLALALEAVDTALAHFNVMAQRQLLSLDAEQAPVREKLEAAMTALTGEVYAHNERSAAIARAAAADTRTATEIDTILRHWDYGYRNM